MGHYPGYWPCVWHQGHEDVQLKGFTVWSGAQSDGGWVVDVWVGGWGGG